MEQAAAIETKHWRMTVGGNPRNHRKICVATVHPIGDQRILRTSQAALDAGYDVHLIWLGGEPGRSTHGERISETRLSDPVSLRDRLRRVFTVTREAWSSNADLWHIHDFYMLLPAYIWAVARRRPVLYDVHEYYPEYYSGRLRIPGPVRRLFRQAVIRLETHMARRLGGANTVSDSLRARFADAGVPAASTPNFPSLGNFPQPARPLTPQLLQRIVHTGMLIPEYGSETIIEMARELATRAPGVEMVVVRRFPSRAAEEVFARKLEELGEPPNLRLVDPMPVHRLTQLLTSCGIGLSTLQHVGQFPYAVPTKLYEYAVAGLAIVSSDLPASREFCRDNAVATFARPGSATSFCDGVLSLLREPELTCERVDAAADKAGSRMSWEASCAPRIHSLLALVDAQRIGSAGPAARG